jgi:hypothetical protein
MNQRILAVDGLVNARDLGGLQRTGLPQAERESLETWRGRLGPLPHR